MNIGIMAGDEGKKAPVPPQIIVGSRSKSPGVDSGPEKMETDGIPNLELELIQSYMTQKPVLRGEVGACRIT